MKQSLVITCLAALAVMLIAYVVGGGSLLASGLSKALNTGLKSSLMLAASFLVIGQIQVLLSQELLDRWLQNFKGIKGVVLSALAGSLFPGGPYIFYPFIASITEKAIPFYILISFMYGKLLYDVTRIPMEASLISPTVAAVRNLLSFPIPIIIGLLAERRFANRTFTDIFGRQVK